LSGSIIGVAAGESLTNSGQVRPPDVTNQQSSMTAAEEKTKPRSAKKKRLSKTTTFPTLVANPPEQTRAISPSPSQQDPDSSFRHGWWVISLIESDIRLASAPYRG
jgi:hypothetical protein